MTVECIANRGSHLIGSNFRPFGYFDQSELNQLEIGKEYDVQGMVLHGITLSVLVDDGERAYAIPIQFFEIVDQSIPAHWECRAIDFRKSEDNNEIRVIWGYSDFVNDIEHLYGLIEGDSNDHEKYFAAKNRNS